MKATPKFSISNTEPNINITNDVLLKVNSIRQIYPKHPSLQHSMYVLQEEFNEVLEEMRANDYEINMDNLYKELIDLIAAAYRMIIDNAE